MRYTVKHTQTEIDSQYPLCYGLFADSIQTKEVHHNMNKNHELTNYLTDINIKASIAFGIALIVILLTYLAFFK